MFNIFKPNNEVKNNNDNKQEISKEYLKLRKAVLNYTYRDMNLSLENNQQPYIAIIDIPVDSIVYNNRGYSLILIYGLNTHIYFYSGSYLIDLEKSNEVMKAMQSFFISIPQTFKSLKYTTSIEEDFYSPNTDNWGIYIKTRDGIYYTKKLTDSKEDRFIKMLVNNIQREINKN